MSEMDLETINKTLTWILQQLDGLLPAVDIENARSLIETGEPGVALENLCTQLTEYDVDCPQAVIEQISAAGTAMGLEPTYWNGLRANEE